MKDSQGHEYGDLLKFQHDHLVIWAEKLRPQLAREISEYVRKHNREANGPTQRHQVFRGQDIVQIVIDWPNLHPAYPPIKDDESDLI